MSFGLRKFAVAVAASGFFGTAAVAADLPVKAAPFVGAPIPWFHVWTGLDAAPDSVYGYGGAVFALNHDINQAGWLFRIEGGDGHYNYNLAPGLRQGVDFQTGDVMIGYQTFVGLARLTGYVGADFQNDANNDPLATVKGTKAGIKGQGEIYAPLNESFYLFGLGSISSVWTSYELLGRAGYQAMPLFSLGPEVMALGNDRFGEVRAGSFVSFNIAPAAQLIFSGGYQWDERSDNLNNHKGGYGTVHIRSSF